MALTVAEMIETVGKYCGTSSVAFMNIRMYSGAELYQVKAIYDAIMQREYHSIEQEIECKKQEIKELKVKLRELEKLGVV